MVAVERDRPDDALWIASAISGELRGVAVAVDTLEIAIGDWLHAAGLDAIAIQQMQATDLIGQTLRELAGFLERYAAASHDRGDLIADSLASVRLGHLSERLGKRRGLAEAATSAVEAGELELF